MEACRKLSRGSDCLLSSLIIYHSERWIVTSVLFSYMLWRVVVYNYLGLMYFSGLYLLYLAVQFYTPMGLPDPDEDDFTLNEQPSELGASEDRPVLRSITEFSFWKQATLVVLLSLLCTFSDVFLVPVYWPFLFSYFLVLIFFAVRKHMKHMHKYGYSLEDFRRKRIISYGFS